MDEFAQTRAPDDLFDDDFTPLDAPISRPYEPSEPGETLPSTPGERAPQSQFNPEAQEFTQQEPRPPSQSATDAPQASTDSNHSLPSAPPPPIQPRSTAVRGDRHLTGGLAKPKLTEEELSAKLAAAKLNSAKRAEAHRVAEADEADFQAREARVQVRRQEEGKARRVMDMEREKNRIRKLGAKGGREWDEGKEEAQQQQERGGGYRRGANGGVGRGGRYGELFQDKPMEETYDPRDYEYDFRGRGRGGRGRGRGGRGRGGFQPPPPKIEQRRPDPERDFPALPPSSKPQDQPSVPPDKIKDSLKSNAGEPSWADQVAEAQKPQSAW